MPSRYNEFHWRNIDAARRMFHGSTGFGQCRRAGSNETLRCRVNHRATGRLAVNDYGPESMVERTLDSTFDDDESSAFRSRVNLFAARRAVDRLADEYPPTVLARAFWVYVGLFDLAEHDGAVRVLAAEFGSTFAMTKTSWLRYRTVLQRAGLIEVGRVGTAKPLRLLVPGP